MKHCFFGILLATLATSVSATEYLGLDLGVASKEQILNKLKSEKSPYEDSYGYKGYRDLSAVKVLGYEKFNKLGAVKESWLDFSPKGVLYLISVKFNDAGETFKSLKDALDTKYGKPSVQAFGFNSEYTYHDGKTKISLKRDTFGFGDEQSTALIYEWTPILPEVEKMTAAIEADIKKKNSENVGKDL